jgi:hypothetical protein
MADKINRHYFLDDANKTIYHMEDYPDDLGLTYMGTSDNHNIKMAASVFMRQGKCLTGCKIKAYNPDYPNKLE